MVWSRHSPHAPPSLALGHRHPRRGRAPRAGGGRSYQRFAPHRTISIDIFAEGFAPTKSTFVNLPSSNPIIFSSLGKAKHHPDPKFKTPSSEPHFPLPLHCRSRRPRSGGLQRALPQGPPRAQRAPAAGCGDLGGATQPRPSLPRSVT